MMRSMGFAAIALTLPCTAAPPQPVVNDPSYQSPAQPWRDVDDARARCRDRVEHVRAAAGKPKLERSPASPDKPLLVYAVDHRVDGCGVLIPVADPADVRESPKAGKPELIPAR